MVPVETTHHTLQEWQICWLVNVLFAVKPHNPHCTKCMKCKEEIPPALYWSRSSFVRDAVTSLCNHGRKGYLCNKCDENMVLKVSFEEEKCFWPGCKELLRVDVPKIRQRLIKKPTLLEQYMSLTLAIMKSITHSSCRYSAIARVDCIICGASFPRGGRVTRNCQHARNSCPDCVKQMIDVAVEKGGWNDLRCPYTECKQKLEFEDVRLSASTTAFQR